MAKLGERLLGSVVSMVLLSVVAGTIAGNHQHSAADPYQEAVTQHTREVTSVDWENGLWREIQTPPSIGQIQPRAQIALDVHELFLGQDEVRTEEWSAIHNRLLVGYGLMYDSPAFVSVLKSKPIGSYGSIVYDFNPVFLAKIGVFKQRGLDAMLQELPKAPDRNDPALARVNVFKQFFGGLKSLLWWTLFASLTFVLVGLIDSRKEKALGITTGRDEMLWRILLVLLIAPPFAVLFAWWVAKQSVNYGLIFPVHAVTTGLLDRSNPYWKQIRDAKRALRKLRSGQASAEMIEKAEQALRILRERPTLESRQQRSDAERQRRVALLREGMEGLLSVLAEVEILELSAPDEPAINPSTPAPTTEQQNGDAATRGMAASLHAAASSLHAATDK